MKGRFWEGGIPSFSFTCWSWTTSNQLTVMDRLCQTSTFTPWAHKAVARSTTALVWHYSMHPTSSSMD